MIVDTIKSGRRLAALAAVGAVAIATVGFAASNTVPASHAGDGSAAISGYTITNVKYNLNGTNPSNIDSVGFTVNSAPPAGSTMKVKLVAAGSTWYDCTNAGTAVSCPTAGATVAAADQLQVVIAD